MAAASCSVNVIVFAGTRVARRPEHRAVRTLLAAALAFPRADKCGTFFVASALAAVDWLLDALPNPMAIAAQRHTTARCDGDQPPFHVLQISHPSVLETPDRGIVEEERGTSRGSVRVGETDE